MDPKHSVNVSGYEDTHPEVVLKESHLLLLLLLLYLLRLTATCTGGGEKNNLIE